MPKLLIIADDLTGALDTGVKFAEAGLKTAVSTRCENCLADTAADVAVLCADTRHLPGEEAYREIRSIVEANLDRFPLLMKKTDSGLRGNIGAELRAFLDGTGENALAFLPALPEMRRVTRGGVQYIDGVPVSKSVFGLDPFEPVLDDDISVLLGRQCSVPTRVIARDEASRSETDGDGPVIRIYDAETSDDMRASVSRILADGRTRLLAGCAGLAQALARELSDSSSAPEKDDERGPLLVVCGSVNGVSARQLDYAESRGFERIHLPMEFLLGEGADPILETIAQKCAAPVPLLLDTFTTAEEASANISPEELEDRRKRISRRLGGLIRDLMNCGVHRRILIIGGDTLLALMDELDCAEITPLCEPDRGVVLFELEYAGETRRIMSKSGGFGSEDLLTRL
ncbi:MAG: four-carbon acid sugar kinase family protein [Oscillospiraceae bacterium]|nr:four-carbon acid sugar kinase family protein [Oscillospiraceae bacterium]